MAIASLATYQNRRDNPIRIVHQEKASGPSAVYPLNSGWTVNGYPVGSAPTSAVVPTNATAGALETVNVSGAVQRILRLIQDQSANDPGTLVVADRLSHQGGLSGTSTSTQTTNLPTAALTRHTNGIGVMAALEIYTLLGASGTTATVSYTNTTPTSGQASPAFSFGVAVNNAVGRMVLVPLASGDVGVTAVATVTLAQSSGTAGNFGVTLFYPLLSIPTWMATANGVDEEALFGFGSWFPQVVDNACLQLLVSQSAATLTGIFAAHLYFGQD